MRRHLLISCDSFMRSTKQFSFLSYTSQHSARYHLIAWMKKCRDSLLQLSQVSDRNINGNATRSVLCSLYLLFHFLYFCACKKKEICNVVSRKVRNSCRLLLEWRYVSQGLELPSSIWEGNSTGRRAGDVDSIGRLVSTNYRVFLLVGKFTQFGDEMRHRKKAKPLLVLFVHSAFPFLFPFISFFTILSCLVFLLLTCYSCALT